MPKLAQRALKALRIVASRLRTQGLRTTLVWVYGRGVPKLTGVPLVRFSQITPQVFVGGQWQHGKRKLEALGVTGGVNLRSEFDDAARWALAEYCYLPTIDDDAPRWNTWPQAQPSSSA